MSNDARQETQPAGRRISVLAFGDNAGELEMAALDEARAFFGEGWRLAVVPDYQVWALESSVDSFTTKYADKINGKRYYANVIVQIIEPE